jgi:hypothetical protein
VGSVALCVKAPCVPLLAATRPPTLHTHGAVVTACWAPRRLSSERSAGRVGRPGSADGKLVAFDARADERVPDWVFAKGANIAVGAHPPVSPLDRRGTESKLRRLELSACSEPATTQDLLLRAPRVVRVCSLPTGECRSQLNRRTTITARIAAAVAVSTSVGDVGVSVPPAQP